MIGAPPDFEWHYVGAVGEPAFAGGWANYDTGYPNTRFRKTAEDVVHVQMAVASGAGSTIFTLPAGYRPSGNIDHPGLSNGQQLVRVSSAGVVQVVAGGSGPPYIFMFSFPVDQ